MSTTSGCGKNGGTRAAVILPESPAPRTDFRYEEVAARSGLRFRWSHGGKTPLTNLESFGCGAAFLDYDQDGWQDILLVAEPHCVLFHNVSAAGGARRFANVTQSVGLDRIRGPWKGCAVGDYDGDGRLDVFLGGYHTAALLRQDAGPDGGVRFSDATRASRLRHRGWASSGGFADFDRDGDLDLYVGNYVKFGPDSLQYCDFAGGVRGGCPPHVYPAEKGVLYRNNGDGTFTDVTVAAGMGGSYGKTLAIGWCDFDDDGDPDLYLANDGVPGDLYRNDGGRFTNIGIMSGTAFGLQMNAQAGMGVDWADFNLDGLMDLVVTAFSNEPYSLYRNQGGAFDNVSGEMGIAGPTFKSLGFGCRFIDVDNDGWRDLVFANGHVYDQAGRMDPLTPFRQKSILMQNDRGRRFTDVSKSSGDAFQLPIVGRGLAVGDYDNDGLQDILIVDYEGAPLLLHNVTRTTNHWARFRLQSRPAAGGEANWFAYGARVILEAGTKRYVAELTPVSSYLSSSDPRVHFGLGPGATIDCVRVRWPDGTRESFRSVFPDRDVTLTKGTGWPDE